MYNYPWSKTLLYDFIKTYRHRECLWLESSQFYYNKTVKQQAYNELLNLIQDDFPNADVLFVKRKIKNIRCAFLKVYKKKIMSERIQGNKIYEPKLWYFDLLMFTILENNKSSNNNASNSCVKPRSPRGFRPTILDHAYCVNIYDFTILKYDPVGNLELFCRYMTYLAEDGQDDEKRSKVENC